MNQFSMGAQDDTERDEKAPYTPSIERALGPQHAAQAPAPPAYAQLISLCPIGAFDSGMGGLSIMRELRAVMPHEDLIFYADNANCPYGGRSDEWLRSRSAEIADFLLDQGAKAIVVACNTASASGLEHLRARHSVPIVGLVPAIKPAVALTRTGSVGVMATKGTMRGRLLSDVIERFAVPAGVDIVTVVPDGLVEAVERGDLDTPETGRVVKQALAPILEAGADAVVLGCTHYPFLRDTIRRLAGDGVAIIDSGEGVARQTMRVLEQRHVLNASKRRGSLTVYTSADPDEVGPTVRRLAGEDVEVLHHP